MRVSVAGSLLLPLLAGCADGAATTTATVRDSVGVSIVESAGPLWQEGEGWHVAAEPEVDIGVVEGEAAYQLHGVRDAARLSDGTLVVAEATRLRFYDQRGRHLRDVGGEGGGPGEYRRIAAVQVLPGDSLLVHDGRQGRVTFLDPAGAAIRTVSPRTPPPLRPGGILGRLDGRLVGWTRAPTEGDAEGFRRDTVVYVAYGAEGELVDTLARGLGEERIEQVTPMPGGVVRVRTMTIPFARDVHHALGPDHLAVAQDDAWRIDLYAPDGEHTASLRRTDVPPRRLVGAELDRYVDWMLENAYVDSDTPPGQIEKQIREARYPDSLPVLRRLRMDSEEHVWAEDLRLPWEERALWTVFDPEGRMLGSVEMPPGLTPYAIGPEWVIGTWRDELDVEHVRLHRLERSR